MDAPDVTMPEETAECPQVPPISLKDHLCFSIYSTSIAINRLYKPMLDEIGITYPQYLVLSALWEEDGRSIGEIAERLSLESSTITPLVKRLEQAGFMTRQRSTADERQVHVHLTQKGQAVRARTSCLKARFQEKSYMTEDEIVRLNQDVQTLLQALTRKAEEQEGKTVRD